MYEKKTIYKWKQIPLPHKNHKNWRKIQGSRSCAVMWHLKFMIIYGSCAISWTLGPCSSASASQAAQLRAWLCPGHQSSGSKLHRSVVSLLPPPPPAVNHRWNQGTAGIAWNWIVYPGLFQPSLTALAHLVLSKGLLLEWKENPSSFTDQNSNCLQGATLAVLRASIDQSSGQVADHIVLWRQMEIHKPSFWLPSWGSESIMLKSSCICLNACHEARPGSCSMTTVDCGTWWQLILKVLHLSVSRPQHLEPALGAMWPAQQCPAYCKCSKTNPVKFRFWLTLTALEMIVNYSGKFYRSQCP